MVKICFQRHNQNTPSGGMESSRGCWVTAKIIYSAIGFDAMTRTSITPAGIAHFPDRAGGNVSSVKYHERSSFGARASMTTWPTSRGSTGVERRSLSRTAKYSPRRRRSLASRPSPSSTVTVRRLRTRAPRRGARGRIACQGHYIAPPRVQN